MPERARLAALAAFLVFGSVGAAAASPLSSFTLRDQRGQEHTPLGSSKATAVVFVAYGIGCPIGRRSLPALRALRGRYEKKGVLFYLLDASVQDGPDEAAREASDYGIDLPLLLDRTQRAARSLGLTRTAEAVVVDAARRTVVYRGAIDDQQDYAGALPRPRRSYLADALESFLGGRPIKVASTAAKGCFITFRNGR